MNNLVLVGGAGGIGRSLAVRALSDGWDVTVMDLERSLVNHPPEKGIKSIKIDLTEPASILNAFSGFKALSGFVNLAGFMNGLKSVEETTEIEFDDIMNLNLKGAFLVAKTVLPLLKVNGGSMVNLVSGLACHVRPNYGAYGASKAALINLTKTLALEAAPTVRINAVGPAAVDTAFLRGGTGRSNENETVSLDIESYIKITPLKRMALPADIVGPIMFLLGSDSQFMTGQTLWVNGGGYMP
jgi:NAD(P)-dependent dehydrogenase (short-subunit alcohol dehydrogenase family)